MSRRRLLECMLFGYAAVLAVLTLTPRSVFGVSSPIKQGGLSDFAGNIVMFVPFGLLAPLIWRRVSSLKPIVLAAAGFSILIEICQLFIPGRTASVNDVTLNVLGALTGAVVTLELLTSAHDRREND